jgi:hypothetical protein
LVVTALPSIQKFVFTTLPQETIEICEDMFFSRALLLKKP